MLSTDRELFDNSQRDFELLSLVLACFDLLFQLANFR